MEKTTKTSTTMTTVNNITCPNCGAKITVKESCVITENSKKEREHTPEAEQAVQQLYEMAKGNPNMMSLVKTLMVDIDNTGYLDVKGIVRRWIPSQCLRMLFSDEGFHKALIHKGYMYSWEVALEDLYKQCKMMRKGDEDGAMERNRWYNKTVVSDMANHYIAELDYYMHHMPIHTCNRREYVKLTCKWHNGKGVFVDEISSLIGGLTLLCKQIEKAKRLEDVYYNAVNFYRTIKTINWMPATASLSFINSYKAAGAYYTMKDLIIFEGCKMVVDNRNMPIGSRYYFGRENGKLANTEKSLSSLELKVNDIIANEYGISNSGYMLMGLLKDFLELNHFNYIQTKQKWSEESEKRRVQRLQNRSNRRQF